MVATVRQHGADDSGGSDRICQTKDAERRDKMSMRAGEDQAGKPG